MCLFRYRKDCFLHKVPLYGVELQRGNGEDDQTQYTDEYPQDSLDDPADVLIGHMLYQNSIGYMFLLQSRYGTRSPSKTNRRYLHGRFRKADSALRNENTGLRYSTFWHRYAMTIHSPSGTNPTNFGAQHLHQHTGTFANNEIDFTDNQNLNYEMLGNGLRKATHNFMNGLGFDIPVQKWFDEIVPKTTIHKNYIRSCMK